MHSSSRIEGQLHPETSWAGGTFSVSISDEISLVCSPATGEGKTKDIPKGLFLCCNGEILAGESTGFGLPVLKARCRTYFPSLVSASSIDSTRCEMVFQLDRVEILHVFGIKTPPALAWFVEVLLHAYMQVPKYQQFLLKLGAAYRSRFHVYGFIVPCTSQGRCRVEYELRDRTLVVSIDASQLKGRGQLTMLNEASGVAFDRVRIGDHVWEGSRIPGWKSIPFGTVLESTSAGCGFSISALEDKTASGWRLACGREVARNLNWAGFALMTDQARFAYRVTFHRSGEI